MATALQILTTMHSFRGLNAKQKVREIYNNYAKEHNKSKTSDDAWCSETVSAAFIKSNAVKLIGDIAKDSSTHVKHFKQLGIWKSGHDRIPNPGDILIRSKDGKPNHTEMVFSVDEKRGILTAISGNYLGNVGLRTRKIHDPKTYGYGCPKYSSYKIVTPDIVEKIFLGKYGKGTTIGTQRFNQLALDGYNPNEVQKKVNWVINIAQDIKDGKPNIVKIYGNDEQRKQALGKWYDVVQKQINVLYNIDMW